jgi:hypothetical protein
MPHAPEQLSPGHSGGSAAGGVTGLAGSGGRHHPPAVRGTGREHAELAAEREARRGQDGGEAGQELERRHDDDEVARVSSTDSGGGLERPLIFGISRIQLRVVSIDDSRSYWRMSGDP